MVNSTVYSVYCKLVAAGNIFPFLFEMYYNNNLYTQFGVNTFPVKILRLIENINNGHSNVYLSICNILNVTENLNTTLESD